MTIERYKYILHVNPFAGGAKEREIQGAEVEEILNNNLLPFDTLTHVLDGAEAGTPYDISSPGFVIELPYELPSDREDSLADLCKELNIILYKIPPEGGSIIITPTETLKSRQSLKLADPNTKQSHFINRYGNKYVWRS